MNPFALTGFGFLGFYLLLGLGVIWGLRAWIRHLESVEAPPAQNMTDPYLIAHLRAGENEALRVATVALLDRGLLVAEGENLKTKNTNAFGVVQRPIEKAILQHYASPGAGHMIFKDAGAKSACASYEKVLKNQRMIADGSTYTQRFLPVAVALGLLIAVTVAASGRTNPRSGVAGGSLRPLCVTCGQLSIHGKPLSHQVARWR